MREFRGIIADRKVFGSRGSFGSSVRLFVVPWVLVVFLAGKLSGQDVAGQEILFPGKEFAKLDTFEGLNLEDADKLFGKEDYKGAFAAYKAYSFEFAKSGALPYVLLRMGRCLQKVEKRNAAIKAYQDVVDYFPNAARYAAGALYYIGECHGLNGDEAKKTAAWAKMVKDDDYVTQPNSGTALTYLGKVMEERGKFDEATEYHWRTAVAFVETNPRAAAEARNAVIAHFVQRSPNHEKLKEFYVEASGFDGRGQKTEAPEEDQRYWSVVLGSALGTKGEAANREKSCAYWGAKFADRFTDNDELRKQWCDVLLVSEKDSAAWKARMDQQFARKTATIARVLQWCDFYKVDPKMRSEFFAVQSQPLVTGMKTDEKMSFMNSLRHPLGMHDEAQSVMRSVRAEGLSDEDLVKYGSFVGNYEPEETVLRYFAKIKDQSMAAKARFEYYSQRSHRNPPNMEKALAEVPILLKDPRYAGGLVMRRANFQQSLGRYEEAIQSYRSANEQPASTWGVTDCLVALKQFGNAVQAVQQLESVGGQNAAQACLKIADIYKISGDKGKEVTQLRLVLKRYPKSGQSSEAHNRLESYGVALIGGEAEAEE